MQGEIRVGDYLRYVSALHREGFWVAVLPFTYGGGNADLMALAEGLTDDIITGLIRIS